MVCIKNKMVLKRAGIFLLAVGLIGCASLKASDADTGHTLEARLTEAADSQISGQPEKSMELYKVASTKFPSDKRPWLRMAQIKFDAASYAEAILYAQEALQRDSFDQVANSIVAVGGLRLSTNALAELRKLNNLSGPVRSEAQDLARVLREHLGEPILLPSAGPASGAGSAAPAPVRHAAAGQKKKLPSKPVVESSSPFGALK